MTSQIKSRVEVPDFLSHLRRDRRGWPVPFVNRYGKREHVERLDIRHDPSIGALAVFYDDLDDHPDVAEPDFTSQNISRARQCVVEGLCQVCGRKIPWSRRFLVYGDLSIDTIEHDGRRLTVITEPWLDERCAFFALKICPALIRRTRAENLRMLAITSRTQVQIVLSTGWIEGPLEARSREIEPVMWAKIAASPR